MWCSRKKMQQNPEFRSKGKSQNKPKQKNPPNNEDLKIWPRNLRYGWKMVTALATSGIGRSKAILNVMGNKFTFWIIQHISILKLFSLPSQWNYSRGSKCSLVDLTVLLFFSLKEKWHSKECQTSFPGLRWKAKGKKRVQVKCNIKNDLS